MAFLDQQFSKNYLNAASVCFQVRPNIENVFGRRYISQTITPSATGFSLSN